MHEYPRKRKAGIRGFGMNVDYEEKGSRGCWEWFDVINESQSKKLQETGELGIRFGAIGERWEVVYTAFMTDISFRIELKEPNESNQDLIKWRFNIRQGSYLKWPALVNEEVVMAEPTT
jgi:hypothetical protein